MHTDTPAGAHSSALSATGHLRLWLLRSVLALLQRAGERLGSLDELMARYPALRAYVTAAAAAGLEGMELLDALRRLDRQLAAADGRMDAPAPLPLARLRVSLALDADSISGFLLCAWADDEPELGALFDALNGHDGRPTRAMLGACGMDGGVNLLLAAGYLAEPALGRRRVLTVPPPVWQALQGQVSGPWRHTPHDALPRWEELILPPDLLAAGSVLPGAAEARCAGEPLCWALRGGPGSGRHALAGAIARAAGLGLLAAPPHDDGATGEGGPDVLPALATLLGALPLLTLEPAPGERIMLPDWPGYRAPMAVRLPRHGGVGADGRQLRWLDLGLPEPQERARHWRRALGRDTVGRDLVDLRLPRGSIHRLAARVAPADIDNPAIVMAELEAQGRFLLDGAARRVPPLGGGEPLALSEALQAEFDALLARCRHREALRELLPGAFGHGGSGVRALFKGPSGTGKTLAARHLAAALARPLYRVDLATTVSKYIGETERNLERVFEAAESLDIVLLLDEGDALMAGRTGVSNATDRYANLETNYLLQRLETYEGVLVVTTNAAERIDAAFSRRMDLTLDFAPPDASMRYQLWRSHLPAGHAVDDAALDQVAQRCSLTGGQIRNAALHAALLGLEAGAGAGPRELLAALRREYLRAGQHCPSLVLD